MLAEERAEPSHLVQDAVGPERVPEGDGIDRKHGLAEPALGLVGEANHREVRADLHDRIHVGAVQLVADEG